MVPGDIFNIEERVRRFWSHVQKTDGCWLWAGNRSTNGYGQVDVTIAGRQRKIPAHRFAVLITDHRLPSHLRVLHRCDTPLCVRPDHLFLGTQRDNLVDCVRKGRSGGHAGKGSRGTKLTPAAVREIRARLAAGETQTALGLIYGVSQVMIGCIARGKAWAHVDRGPVSPF